MFKVDVLMHLLRLSQKSAERWTFLNKYKIIKEVMKDTKQRKSKPLSSRVLLHRCKKREKKGSA